jgi:threonine dehydratase
VAGLKKYLARHPAEDPHYSYIAILSGANVNFERLRFIAERTALGDEKEVFMSLLIPETPGSFFRLCQQVISPRVVTEFTYRMDDPEWAAVYISFQVKEREIEVSEIMENCKAQGYEAEDISNNEMAKTHARYLIGGRADVEHERLYQIEFPERPGALLKFLHDLPAWNISLFHYRNHGHGVYFILLCFLLTNLDVGQILAGIQLPGDDNKKFEAYLTQLGYPHKDETNNSVYTRFMKHNRVKK